MSPKTRPSSMANTFEVAVKMAKLLKEREMLKKYVHPETASEISDYIWGSDECIEEDTYSEFTPNC